MPLAKANGTPETWRQPARQLFQDGADIQLVDRLHADDFATVGYPMWWP